jgi:hypothetical protein
VRPARAGAPVVEAEAAKVWPTDEDLDDEAKEFWETWADEKAVRRQQARPDENQPRSGGRDQARTRDAEPGAARGRNGNAASRRTRDDAAPKTRDADSPRARDDARPKTTRDADSPRARDEDRPKTTRDTDSPRARDDARPKTRDADSPRARDAAPPRARDAAPGRSDEDEDDAAEGMAGDSARLYVNVGKREGLTASDVRRILGEGVSEDIAGRIGPVALRNTHCYVRVPEDIVDDVITSIAGKMYEGREMVVERARR